MCGSQAASRLSLGEKAVAHVSGCPHPDLAWCCGALIQAYNALFSSKRHLLKQVKKQIPSEMPKCCVLHRLMINDLLV